MKIVRIIVLCLVFVSGLYNIVLADTSEGDLGVAFEGAACTYIPLIAVSPTQAWALVKIVSDKDSGIGRNFGDAPIFGTYSVVHQLGSKTFEAESDSYSWSIPPSLMNYFHAPGSDYPTIRKYLESAIFCYNLDIRNPAEATRYILCILNNNAIGKDKFTHIHLVPPGWVDDVVPAVNYLRAHPEITGKSPSKEALSKTDALLQNQNPYLVLAAVQILAANRHLTSSDMDTATDTTDYVLLASTIAVARLYLWSNIAGNDHWMSGRIERIKTMDELQSIVLSLAHVGGAISPGSIDTTADLPLYAVPYGSADGKDAEDLCKSSLKKLNELDPSGNATDKQWRFIDEACRGNGA